MAVVTLTFYEYDDPPVDGGATAVGTITDAELEHFAMRKVLSTKGIHNAEVIVNRHDAAADLLVQGRWMTIDIPVLKDDGPILAVRLGPRFETVVSEDEEAGEVVQIGGLGVLSQLKRARLLEEFYAPGQIARGSSPSLPGEWSWREGAGIAYGGIMVRGIEEGQEQPGAPLEHITITFDREDNSAGIAWPHITDEFRQAIGTDVGTLHDRLAEGGRLFLREHADLSIDGFSAFGQDDFGVDRTTASFATGKVLFTVAPDVVSNLLTGLEEEGEEEAYTHVIVEGANGVYVTRTSPSYSSGPGKWGFVSYNDSDDQQLLEDVGDEFLARSADQTQARELEIAPGDDEDNGLYLPVKHFNEGDLVSLSAGPIDEDVRLVAWRLELASATSDADAEAEARSLHIVVETDAITSADSDAPGGLAGPPGSDTPGLCCGPRPPTPPSTSGGGTLRLYPSAHLAGDDATAQSLAAPNLIGADSGSDGDYISTWAARESGEAEWYMMYAEPQDSVSASTMNWAATNDGAAYYPIGAFMVKIGSGTDDPDGRILSIVQGGGSMKVQLRARSRYGTGISESAQNHLLAAAARVYRPGSGFVGTSFALSTIGDLKFAAQATPVNRSGTATLAAVAGAADGDYLCVEFGVQHLGPTGGGTGATLAWSDTADTDLPEDQVTTTVLNSWVELTGSGASSGDTPNPTVLPGDESFGDGGCYAPCTHTHAAGQLSSDGEHFFDASGIEYDGGESGLSATDVQQAIDALAAGAAAGQVSAHGALGTTEEFDASEADGHSGTLDDDLTVTLAGATDGEESWLTLYLTDDGGGPYDITWPDSVSWPGGVEPDSPPAGQTLVVTLVSIDGGTTWYGSYPGTGSATTSANFFTVDPGTPTYDDTSGVEVSLTSKFGIDSNGDPYFNDAGVTSGEEAALMRDSSNGTYFLRPYNF